MNGLVTAERIGETPKGQAGRRARIATLALAVFVALSASALCFRFLPIPFVWISWGGTATLLAGVWFLRKGFIRVVMFNAAVLLAAFAMAETYCTLHQPEHPTFSEGYYVSDEVLGTVPPKQARAHSTEVQHGKLVYDVTYTTGSNGLRIAPPSNGPRLDGSVLFFGCSFTYGEGVQDDETLPYQVGIQSGGRYQTYNFGFHGYGPNQVLAAIESGRVREAVDTAPRYAIYQALPDHIARVAGKIPYGKHNPRYRLDADGTVQLAGHFDDDQKTDSAFKRRVRGQLRKSAIYRRLESLEPPTDESDVRLLLAVMRKSKDLLAAQYPGIEFRIILWRNFDYEQKSYDELREGFTKMNIPVHLVENILPDYNVHPEKYWLGPEDRHPNALADRLMANYVVTKILSPDLGAPKLHQRVLAVGQMQ